MLINIYDIVRKKPNNVDVKDRISNGLGLTKDQIEFTKNASEKMAIGVLTDEVTVPKMIVLMNQHYTINYLILLNL